MLGGRKIPATLTDETLKGSVAKCSLHRDILLPRSCETWLLSKSYRLSGMIVTCGATQHFWEFEYTAQTVSAMNLHHYVLLFVSFIQQCAKWHLYKCTCFQVLAVFFTPFHVCLWISKWRVLRSKELAINFSSNSTKLQLRTTKC